MNIIKFSEGLQAKMKKELDNLNTDQDEIIKISKVLTFIRGLITDLKAFAGNYKFQNQAEEVQFFKEIKPVFLSQYFYYKKVFAIRLFDTFKDVKSRQANYYILLNRLEKYVERNLEFYQYSMSGNTFMDAHYFTRQNKNNKSLDRDESFSTGYDTKLAKVLANELVRNYILKRLDQTDLIQPELTWTGSKTDLIELVYALHTADVFNNGSVDIKRVANAFQRAFNVNLGDYYRIFINIRLRKSNKSTFLDRLRDKMNQRLQMSEKH
jgi:hypothetical protein